MLFFLAGFWGSSFISQDDDKGSNLNEGLFQQQLLAVNSGEEAISFEHGETGDSGISSFHFQVRLFIYGCHQVTYGYMSSFMMEIFPLHFHIFLTSP
jgi:hypothetical protein